MSRCGSTTSISVVPGDMLFALDGEPEQLMQRLFGRVLSD